jgi:hypothetical protein
MAFPTVWYSLKARIGRVRVRTSRENSAAGARRCCRDRTSPTSTDPSNSLAVLLNWPVQR